METDCIEGVFLDEVANALRTDAADAPPYFREGNEWEVRLDRGTDEVTFTHRCLTPTGALPPPDHVPQIATFPRVLVASLLRAAAARGAVLNEPAADAAAAAAAAAVPAAERDAGSEPIPAEAAHSPAPAELPPPPASPEPAPPRTQKAPSTAAKRKALLARLAANRKEKARQAQTAVATMSGADAAEGVGAAAATASGPEVVD